MRYSPCPELKDKDWLYQQYVCNGRTMKYIADELKVSSSRVFSWLNKHNIKTRTQSSYLKGKKFSEEHKLKMSLASKGKSRYWTIRENNPNWQGGRTKAVQLERTTVRYKNWKDFIFNRDIFCVNCGSTNQRVAHHIKSYQEYQELRFDVWNGVILCRSCHSAYHACLSVNGFNSKNIQNGQLRASREDYERLLGRV
ncbi:MAG: hypothetical protein A2W75_04065 [Nitrospinae bacterium RIFCSPLOWO2_12_39_15]|nr:MAG: hypothetical protein A2W75_04065 [Nitrospinae bacterium RIFCSPLOWO2_12_39_15]